MNKRYLMALFFIMAGFVSLAQYDVQSKYFVYLQTEPAQPFYIKINNQNISANSSGYLILPQLKDGDYKLVVGFPQNKYPEQTFNFKIDSKDKGYLIKNFGDEGWGLFDLQTMVVEKPLPPGSADVAGIQKPATAPETIPKENVSDFTKVLSKAANDPSLLEKPKPAPPPPVVEKPVEEKPVVKEVAVTPEKPIEQKPVVTETGVEAKPIEKELVVVPEKRAEPGITTKPDEAAQVSSAPQEPVKTGEKNLNSNVQARDITKVMQNESEGGVTIVYEEKAENGRVEPITIFIPDTKKVENTTPAIQPTLTPVEQAPVVEQPKQEIKEPVVEAPKQVFKAPVVEQPKQEVKEMVKETSTPQPKEAVVEPVAQESKLKKIFRVKEKPPVPQDPASEKEAISGSVKPTGTCRTVADETDFLRLRRQMAQRDNDEQMISEAKRAFRNKCYTTAQVKYLSSMFLSNAGKYNFYEAAYPHVADAEKFSSLQSEIRDTYYIEKFKALMGN